MILQLLIAIVFVGVVGYMIFLILKENDQDAKIFSWLELIYYLLGLIIIISQLKQWNWIKYSVKNNIEYQIESNFYHPLQDFDNFYTMKSDTL